MIHESLSIPRYTCPLVSLTEFLRKKANYKVWKYEVVQWIKFDNWKARKHEVSLDHWSIYRNSLKKSKSLEVLVTSRYNFKSWKHACAEGKIKYSGFYLDHWSFFKIHKKQVVGGLKSMKIWSQGTIILQLEGWKHVRTD